MLFLLVPGVLYLLLANTTVRLTITAYATDTGSRLVVGGDNPLAIQQTIDYANKLPKPGEWKPGRPAIEKGLVMEHEAGVPERIRRLAKLRDDGLILQPRSLRQRRRIYCVGCS